MSSYTDVFGGETLYPAGQTYLALTFSADQDLAWPIEQAVAGQNVVASIMDLDATAAGLNVDIPDARQVSNGIQSVFNNVGANTITIRDDTGGTIIWLASGTAWVVYLTDNSTQAGTWRSFQLGASTSVADAAALAGAGLKAISSTLNQRIAPTSASVSPVTWVDGNRAQLTIWTGGVGVLNLPTPAVVGSDWFAMVRNSGSGDLTLTPPAGLIDSVATLALAPGQSAIVVTDGTDFYTIGLGQSTAGFFDFVEINVAGSGDFVLSGVQLNRISYRFVGALTGNRNIVVPNTVQQYWVDNSTTGAFSLFINTVAQVTPVEVLQGDRTITYCDGNDVLAAESATVSFPISIAQGGTGANNAATALSNLGGVSTGRLLNTLANSGLSGGGDLSADRNLALDVDNLTVENAPDFTADTVAFYDDSAGAMRKTALGNIGAIEILEEGAPLATRATSLDFVGGIVTASGATAAKTITIPIDASTGASHVLRGDGAGGWVEETSLTISAVGSLSTTGSIASSDGAANLSWSTTAGVSTFIGTGGLNVLDFAVSEVQFGGSIFLDEQATSLPDNAGQGQFWVENLTPNRPKFTDDTGIDFDLGYHQYFNKDGDSQSVNNSVALVNVTSMENIRLESNAIYRIEIQLKVNQANAAANLQLRLTAQGAGTIAPDFWQITSVSANGTFTFQDTNLHTVLGATQNVTGNHVYRAVGMVVSGTGDLWDLQFAQQVAQVANTLIDDESFMIVTRIA